MIADTLRFVARHGRVALIAGLAGGLLLPDLALAMRPWLSEMVAVLLFLTAFRIGPRAALGTVAEAGGTLRVLLFYQLLLPLAAFGVLSLAGVADTVMALSVILVMSAASLAGAPNLTIMMGHDPAPALRLLILGTALLPLTVLPILWLVPAFGEAASVLAAAGRLLAVIGGAVGAGFLLRHFTMRDLPPSRIQVVDGLSAIGLAIIVVGLMSAIGPALQTDPAGLLAWLALAFAVNLGLQVAANLILRRYGDQRRTVSFSIIAGNRNIVLLLIALPPETTEQLLIFIGCYQIPMYLTPILMRKLYGRNGAPEPAGV